MAFFIHICKENNKREIISFHYGAKFFKFLENFLMLFINYDELSTHKIYAHELF